MTHEIISNFQVLALSAVLLKSNSSEVSKPFIEIVFLKAFHYKIILFVLLVIRYILNFWPGKVMQKVKFSIFSHLIFFPLIQRLKILSDLTIWVFLIKSVVHSSPQNKYFNKSPPKIFFLQNDISLLAHYVLSAVWWNVAISYDNVNLIIIKCCQVSVVHHQLSTKFTLDGASNLIYPHTS